MKVHLVDRNSCVQFCDDGLHTSDEKTSILVDEVTCVDCITKRIDTLMYYASMWTKRRDEVKDMKE